ncbi:copper resistance protein CopC [Streptomyces sp. F63]|uniref:copper resistance CopC family protein n=1 Tax=Streptomyces sp. F63 TaxID=2824887 RepID=UPI001B37428B|nr:copper resistance CopC family protein [Streptomyces sp. F63]MBQ0985435.1 copper resistance protein CopC [Streptomyces sp. F63]
MRRLRVLRGPAALSAATVLCPLLLLGGTPAYAHSALKDATPAPGATVGTGTRVVALSFGGLRPGAPAKVALTGPDGTEVPVGRPVVADDSVVCAAVRPLRAGITTLTYTITAADGDAQTSAYQFEVADGAEPAATPPPCRGLDLAAPDAREPARKPRPKPEAATGEDETIPGLGRTTALAVLALAAVAAAGAGVLAVLRMLREKRSPERRTEHRGGAM